MPQKKITTLNLKMGPVIIGFEFSVHSYIHEPVFPESRVEISLVTPFVFISHNSIFTELSISKVLPSQTSDPVVGTIRVHLELQHKIQYILRKRRKRKEKRSRESKKKRNKPLWKHESSWGLCRRESCGLCTSQIRRGILYITAGAVLAVTVPML